MELFESHKKLKNSNINPFHWKSVIMFTLLFVLWVGSVALCSLYTNYVYRNVPQCNFQLNISEILQGHAVFIDPLTNRVSIIKDDQIAGGYYLSVKDNDNVLVGTQFDRDSESGMFSLSLVVNNNASYSNTQAVTVKQDSNGNHSVSVGKTEARSGCMFDVQRTSCGEYGDYLNDMHVGGIYYTGGSFQAPEAYYMERKKRVRLPPGTSVSINEEGFIDVCENNARCLGVVNYQASVVHNAQKKEWHGKYIRNANGSREISKHFNESLTYVPRDKRDEWHPVTRHGFVLLRKDQHLNSNWNPLYKKINPKPPSGYFWVFIE